MIKTLFPMLLLVLSINTALGEEYKHSSKFHPTDYMFKDYERDKDSAFDDRMAVELNIDLGIGSDCGKINFHNTLKSSLKNILDTKYFGKLGMDILAASPMLLTCYLSPTWCSILKHSRVQANYLGQMRLDQCALIDKWTDSRTEDFYAERQECIHKAIEKHNGDIESAMQECKNGNTWSFDLSDWSGRGGKVSENRLLESSARWANMNDGKSKETLNLLKSIVGETIVSKGKISIDYGPRKVGQTPRGYFLHLSKNTYETLCDEILVKAVEQRARSSINQIVKNEDLKKISGNKSEILIDRQTIRSLVYMPRFKRDIACKKLSKGIALTRFTKDMSDSLDFLYKSSQNVNLPEKRRKQIENKRSRLKEAVKETIELFEKKSHPLNKILKDINLQGAYYVDKATKNELDNDTKVYEKSKLDALYWDCADGFMCQGGN